MAVILVVDDSMFQRYALSKIIKEAGHKLIEAENGKAGLDKAIAEKPDCILLDLNMPEMDGVQVLGNLRSSNPGTPVLILTADIQDSSRAACMERGAFAFINKPIKEQEVAEAIAKALDSRSKGC